MLWTCLKIFFAMILQYKYAEREHGQRSGPPKLARVRWEISFVWVARTRFRVDILTKIDRDKEMLGRFISGGRKPAGLLKQHSLPRAQRETWERDWTSITRPGFPFHNKANLHECRMRYVSNSRLEKSLNIGVSTFFFQNLNFKKLSFSCFFFCSSRRHDRVWVERRTYGSWQRFGVGTWLDSAREQRNS